MKGLRVRIKKGDLIEVMLGEPELSGMINSNKDGLTVACGERNDCDPVLGFEIKQSELVRWSRTGTTWSQITAGYTYPDTSTTVKRGSPGVAAKYRKISKPTDARCK